MKKRFKLTDLDCANCAAKMEEAIKKIDGVKDATVSFMAQKMTVEADDARFDDIMKEIVERVRGQLPGEDTLYDLTELFRIFGDSTRVRILYVLFEAEMCVCDIAQLLGMTQSAISHQLRALKNVRLVKSRREGKTVFYSLADDHVKTIIDQGLEHVSE